MKRALYKFGIIIIIIMTGLRVVSGLSTFWVLAINPGKN
jgi:hypothetical protein